MWRIFELYAAGASLKRIAKLFNDERIPSPRLQKRQVIEDVVHVIGASDFEK